MSHARLKDPRAQYQRTPSRSSDSRSSSLCRSWVNFTAGYERPRKSNSNSRTHLNDKYNAWDSSPTLECGERIEPQQTANRHDRQSVAYHSAVQTPSPRRSSQNRSAPPSRQQYASSSPHTSPDPRSRSLPPIRSHRRLNILVVGSTGAGKSTFISTQLAHWGRGGAKIGHSLSPCTSDFDEFLCKTQDGQKVNFIDSPGFNDPRFSDPEILAKLATLLRALHTQGQQIDGLIFITPVTDVRLRGPALKMAEVVKRVCGHGFYKHIALVTSMWDRVEPQHYAAATRRASSMIQSPQFWKDFRDGGAEEFEFENDYNSANDVVRWLTAQCARVGHPPQLTMSVELQKDFLLSETDAGIFLQGELSKKRQRHIQTVQELRREIALAQQSGDRVSAAEFAAEEKVELACAREAAFDCRLFDTRVDVVC